MVLKKLLKRTASVLLAGAMTASMAFGVAADTTDETAAADDAGSIVTVDGDTVEIDLSTLDMIVDYFGDSSDEGEDVSEEESESESFMNDVYAALAGTLTDASGDILEIYTDSEEADASAFDIADKNFEYSYVLSYNEQSYTLSGEYDKEENKITANLEIPELGSYTASLQYKDDYLTVECPELFGSTVYKVKITEKFIDFLTSGALQDTFDIAPSFDMFSFDIQEDGNTKTYTMSLPWETIKSSIDELFSQIAVYGTLYGAEMDTDSIASNLSQIDTIIDTFAQIEDSEPKIVFTIVDDKLQSIEAGFMVEQDGTAVFGAKAVMTLTAGVPEVLASDYASYKTTSGLTCDIKMEVVQDGETVTSEASSGNGTAYGDDAQRVDTLLTYDGSVFDLVTLYNADGTSLLLNMIDSESGESSTVAELSARDVVVTADENSGALDLNFMGSTLASLSYSVKAK